MLNNKELEIIEFLKKKQECSSKEIHDGISATISYATTKRILIKLASENLLGIKGHGKGTKYFISSAYQLLEPINIGKYYEQEIDERKIKEIFNFQLITDVLNKVSLFTDRELEKLMQLQNTYRTNVAQLSESAFPERIINLLTMNFKYQRRFQVCVS